MKFTSKILWIIAVVSAFFQCGCENNSGVKVISGENTKINISLYRDYSPKKVEILSLSQYVNSPGKDSHIKVYVAMMDQFNSQIKNAGTFRFELYERILHSAEPKGKRIAIWDDIVLRDAAENNLHWRDFLRAYQFALPIESEIGCDYILEVTFMSPDGARLCSTHIFHMDK